MLGKPVFQIPRIFRNSNCPGRKRMCPHCDGKVEASDISPSLFTCTMCGQRVTRRQLKWATYQPVVKQKEQLWFNLEVMENGESGC